MIKSEQTEEMAPDQAIASERRSRGRLVWIVMVSFAVFSFAAVVFIVRQPANEVNVALDRLSRVSIQDRWAHPEMGKIRKMGAKGVSALRRALREEGSKRTRFLLWAGGQWPGVTNYVADFPNLAEIESRRWAACQAIKQLGPAARAAKPELVEMLRHGNVRTWNAASAALFDIGIDREIIEEVGQLLERGEGGSIRSPIISLLGTVKPPSDLTLKVLEGSLHASDAWEQQAALTVIAQLGVKTPGILEQLYQLQRTVTNQLSVFAVSDALWALGSRKRDVWLPTINMLEREVAHFDFEPFGGGSGGQGIDPPELVYLKAAHLWSKLDLTGEEQKRALALLNTFCEKSGRVFIRMSLLPNMLKLGLPLEEAAEVCETGLSAEEDYYRLQAANLVVVLCEKWGSAVNEKLGVHEMLEHVDVGVRVAAASAYWCGFGEKADAEVILPVLLDALNAAKHQSYHYPEIQKRALQLAGELGKSAEAALPILRELAKDVNPTVAKLAGDACEKVARK